MGYDEAVYIEYAKNFANTGISFITLNEKIFLIDTIAMLPHYIFAVPNFIFNFTDVWSFKLISSIISIFTLIVIFLVTNKKYGKETAVLFLFFLCIQPGFGFISSSFFGELLQSAFLIYGLYIAFPISNNKIPIKNTIYGSLLLSLAVQTKFQVAVLVTITLLILYITTHQKEVLKLLGFTILISALFTIIRTIPVILFDYTLLRKMIIITDIFAGPPTASINLIIEKIQLFNRFFPISLFLLICSSFFFYSKNLFERAILYFSVVTAVWWITLYPLSTYRNPFMGIISVCLMASLLAVKAYQILETKYPLYKNSIKLISIFSIITLMGYGYSANLIYAYIGYNDGVQFDLDGYKNRLFDKIEYNSSQKKFYSGLKQYVTPADTIYNGTWVSQYYLTNPICTFDKLKESLIANPAPKFILVTRDLYPLGFEKIYTQIDSLGIKKELVFKTNQHELYRLTK
ncbi:MAG: hypothetical protein IT280_05630 [Ignavibacteria bacterium]|nr:hypothetical protein [Ignavibacteria bacterium]